MMRGWVRRGWRDWSEVVYSDDPDPRKAERECWTWLAANRDDPKHGWSYEAVGEVDGAEVVLPKGIHPRGPAA